MPRSSQPVGATLLDTWGRRNRLLDDRKCEACGADFRPLKSSSRFCSRPCARTINGGQNRKQECWWVNGRGYVEGRIWVGGAQRRVKKHRHLMELSIGRALRPDEDVHHIDGDKLNNDLSNLQVLSHSAHAVLSNDRPRKSGYSLRISDVERAERSRRAKERHAKRRIALSGGSDDTR